MAKAPAAKTRKAPYGKTRRGTTARKRATMRQARRAAEKRAPAQPVDLTPLPVADPAGAGGVLAEAFSLIGVPYRRGGSTPDTGFDCSGFVRYVYRSAGVDLPRSAVTQFAIGQDTGREDLQTGDLVFFRSRRGWHVGIYSGAGNFIHAPNSRDRVKVTPLDEPYYARAYLGARRIFPSAPPPEPPEGLPTTVDVPPASEVAEPVSAGSGDTPQ